MMLGGYLIFGYLDPSGKERDSSQGSPLKAAGRPHREAGTAQDGLLVCSQRSLGTRNKKPQDTRAD